MQLAHLLLSQVKHLSSIPISHCGIGGISDVFMIISEFEGFDRDIISEFVESDIVIDDVLSKFVDIIVVDKISDFVESYIGAFEKISEIEESNKGEVDTSSEIGSVEKIPEFIGSDIGVVDIIFEFEESDNEVDKISEFV